MEKSVVLITGASRGIGRAAALQFAREGRKVAVTARSLQDLESLSFEIRQLGGDCLPLACDLQEEGQIQAAVEHLRTTWGRLDILVNNAGIGTFKTAAQVSTEDWDAVMDTNVRGAFLMTRQCLPLLEAQSSSQIIFIASDVSRRTFPEGSLYCASKFALDAFASALRKELRPKGLRVSVVYPGLVDSNFAGSEAGAAYKTGWLKPEDVARTLAFIANSPNHVVIDELMIHPITQDY